MNKKFNITDGYFNVLYDACSEKVKVENLIIQVGNYGRFLKYGIISLILILGIILDPQFKINTYLFDNTKSEL